MDNEPHTHTQQNRIKIATCHTCHWPIYQGDLIHHSSTGSHSGTVDTVGGSQDMGRGTTVSGSHGTYQGTSQSDQWVQCQWCIAEWGKELVILKVWKWKWGLIIWLTVPIITTLISFFTMKQDVLFGGFLFGLLLAAGVWWIAKFFAPKADRYKFRSYRK